MGSVFYHGKFRKMNSLQADNRHHWLFPTGKNRKPVPHATLARIKQLRSLPFELPGIKAFSLLVDKLHLWESHLNSSGSEYSSVSSFRLAKI
jgi:2'-5' RNA ligase